MSATALTVTGSDAPPPTQKVLDESEYRCPICLELLYKPAIANCGHAFCYWCLNKSMDMLGASSCPLCRGSFQHLPAPCVALSQHVKATFAEEYAAREAEVLILERDEYNATSPPLPDIAGASPDFTCAQCGMLHARVRATVCGHLLCKACSDVLLTPSAIAANARCPKCASRLVSRPRLCGLVATLFGADSSEAASASSAASASEGAGASAAPVERATVEGGVLAAATATATTAQGAAETVADEAESTAAVESFVHYGCGCDGCGSCPIVGRAYRCRDCPEAIGFDLCGACYDVRDSLTAGRFGQAHTAAHRFEERPCAQTWLHVVQAAHPNLSVNQIMQIANAALADEPPPPSEEEA